MNCEGAVNTGRLTPETEKNLAGTYPLRRLGRPQDIANAVIFMASTQADWVTGHVLFVGGGNRRESRMRNNLKILLLVCIIMV